MGDRDSLPANLKSLQPYLDMATDYESMDLFISYWCRLYVLKQGFILTRVEDLPFLLVLMELLEKNKQDLQSKIETTDIPAARAHLQGVVQKLLSWAENVPPLLSLTNVVAKAFESAGMLLDVCSIFGEPNEGESEKKKFTDPHQANLHSEFQSESTTTKSNIQYQDIIKLSDGISGELPNDEKKKNQAPSSTTTDEGENLAQSPEVGKPERRKVYDRLFLFELRNHPVSLKRPEGLPGLEIVRDKMKRDKIIAAGIFIHQKQSQQTPNAHNTENNTYCFEDLSKTSLEVDKKLAMPNPGPLQGRQTKGNNQFFGRQIRPGNQHMPRPPMAEGTINPNHPPNAPQALPYPGMTQPLLFVIGDQFSQQSPYLSYPANPPASYPQSGNLPTGNVSFQQPRAAQQTYGYRQTPPYPTFPMKSTPAVFYQSEPQPQQPQQQQQQQQPQQTQQPQQPQQVSVAPPPIAQPRESSGSSRRARSSNLCIVDPNTNRDVLTGEEVLVSTSVVVTPTTTTPPN
ncbi:mastermind-like protein 2 isoform X2 [Daphnia pulicaria]|uniref:mastermind-like protein 2 isoform X2 n=1 Tax=Daphnia pulicaria TaxID=35523 RepID=UPI001EEA7C9F|nr:mastermind-like protein 2 isoform X2 [Daphnia pulicaria]